MKKRYFCILKTFFLSIILTACNKDNYLPKNLNETDHLKSITKAFQRRFRQELISNIADKECLIISNNIIKKYY